MDIFFEIIKALVLIVMGYVLITNISYISKYVIPITLLTVVAMGLSLLHSETVTTYADGVVGSAALLDPRQVKSFCGDANTNNTFCYKKVEYRGFPFRALTIEHPVGTGVKVDSGRWGAFSDYLIYLGIFIAIAFGVERLRRNNGSTRSR